MRYRQEMRERAKKGGAPAVPITVRQLEAITRVSESLAKMCLQPHVTEEHVQEALRRGKEGGGRLEGGQGREGGLESADLKSASQKASLHFFCSARSWGSK